MHLVSSGEELMVEDRHAQHLSGNEILCFSNKNKTSPQAKRHKPSLLFTSLTTFTSLSIFTSLTIFTSLSIYISQIYWVKKVFGSKKFVGQKRFMGQIFF